MHAGVVLDDEVLDLVDVHGLAGAVGALAVPDQQIDQLCSSLLCHTENGGSARLAVGVFPKKWRRCLCREFVDVSES